MIKTMMALVMMMMRLTTLTATMAAKTPLGRYFNTGVRNTRAMPTTRLANTDARALRAPTALLIAVRLNDPVTG